MDWTELSGVMRLRYPSINIILLPEDTLRARVFHAPPGLVVACALFLLLSMAAMVWFLGDYLLLKAHTAEISRLEKQIEARGRELINLERRIYRVAQNLDQDQIQNDFALASRELCAHLLPGLVGDGLLSEPDLGPAGFKAYREKILNMHSALDYLDDRIKVAAVAGVGDGDSASQDVALAQVSKEEIKRQIVEIADELDLDPVLALSMAKVESGYNPRLVSPKGAVGVLQVMPRTASYYFGVEKDELFHPETNIRAGLTWMQLLLKQFNEDLDLSLAAYNAGVSQVTKAGYRVPPIPETRSYVKKVRQAMQHHRKYFASK